MCNSSCRNLIPEKPWVHCPSGVLKLNFDGSSMGNPGPSRYGCILCDEFRNVVLLACGLLGYCDSIKAEMMGL